MQVAAGTSLSTKCGMQLQIVADTPMLEGIKGEWTLEREARPSAMTHPLAVENYTRLVTTKEEDKRCTASGELLLLLCTAAGVRIHHL